MSRHEGVSCDSCLKSNFRGRRYKCLMCYDYDLCANCYEDGATSTRHSTDHPMQCILTRSDFELYYSGEAYATDQPQSFTCPYCKKMGFSDSLLFDHVSAEHTDTGLEVVCPVCAALPGGDPNLVTDDFAGHLTVEHRTPNTRDLISFLYDEPGGIRHGGVRRIPHSGSSNRALGGPRSRRSNMHFNSAGTLSALSPAGRDSVDPISELLSQLTGVRRGAPQPSQLQQLQMQIQLERQQVTAARQNLERLPRRQPHPVVSTSNTSVIGGGSIQTATAAMAAAVAQAQQAQHGIQSTSSINSRDITITSNPLQLAAAASAAASQTAATAAANAGQSQFLLSRFLSPALVEGEQTDLEHSRADRSLYVQDLLLSTLCNLRIDDLPATSEPQPLSVEEVPEDVKESSPVQEEVTPDDDLAVTQVTVTESHHHLQHAGRGQYEKHGASAKLKSVSMAAGVGKQQPMSGADRPRTTGGGGTRHPQSQQQQSVKARELKSATMSAKESTDSTR